MSEFYNINTISNITQGVFKNTIINQCNNNNNNDDEPKYTYDGCIEMNIGPMFSGKTLLLATQLRKRLIAKEKVLCIKYIGDTRYTKGEKVVNFDNYEVLSTKTIVAGKLSDVEDSEAIKYDVIGVDEGQFFPDVAEQCEHWANMGIDVYVAALSTTYKRDAWVSVNTLVNKAEHINKLLAICYHCHKDAAFTYKVKEDPDEDEKDYDPKKIGGKDDYHPVCRKCYFKHTKR